MLTFLISFYRKNKCHILDIPARRKATGVKHEQTWRASATGWGGQRNTARDAGRTVRVLPQAYRRYKRGFCAGSTQTQHVAARRA